ncbi:MAG: sugar transferase [Pseudomonadota bacterium]
MNRCREFTKDFRKKWLFFYGNRLSLWRLRVRQKHKMFAWNIVIYLSLCIKRLLDIIVSSVALILMAPIFILCGLAIVLEDGVPIFFKQVRVGAFGNLFEMYKLRSMKQDAEDELEALQNINESSDGITFKMRKDPRITRVGTFLRKASLDELPQLYNVLRGNMSLVGPRPALPSEVEEYTLEQRRRLNIKPGITCFWQVSGRSNLSFNQQVRLDVMYLESQSFWLDIKLLLKTIPAVIFARGAY